MHMHMVRGLMFLVNLCSEILLPEKYFILKWLLASLK